jgi:sulfate-transporting ATPase
MVNEETKDKEDRLEFFIPPGPRLGTKVIEADHLSKGYGDRLAD